MKALSEPEERATVYGMKGKIPRELFEVYRGIKSVGDIRVVEGVQNVRRVVMICDWHEEMPDVFTVYLCHPWVDLATSSDYLYRPNETGLPYNILVETDLVGMVYRRQFVNYKLGGISRALFDEMPWMTEWMPDKGYRLPAGLPLRGPRDGRWQWKIQEEYEDLKKIVTPFWSDFVW